LMVIKPPFFFIFDSASSISQPQWFHKTQRKKYYFFASGDLVVGSHIYPPSTSSPREASKHVSLTATSISCVLCMFE
jgi:hypothetical protein